MEIICPDILRVEVINDESSILSLEVLWSFAEDATALPREERVKLLRAITSCLQLGGTTYCDSCELYILYKLTFYTHTECITLFSLFSLLALAIKKAALSPPKDVPTPLFCLYG